MEKRSVPLRHSGLIPYFNTFRVVLKCILATLGSISSPCRATNWRAAFTTWPVSYTHLTLPTTPYV